ncbi:ABC transporter ATP-binding protein [Paenibacillus jamilae]|uniref:Bacitracin ABC transporter ATP-binding protein n=1 Tax=Bacillus thuringiensis serovar subtoxicus TaxID=475791 RepID=A0A9X6IJ12_BACTU|nr:ABC transporter ATP-binding protein [Bacillus thuringiensis]MEB4843673.1 ABC transporter ATP-binding protein [Paenibacillus jamilae]MEB8583198.1 ABC transporter ATP-binding protein [Bacillus cereus]MCR6856482.1 ABC transporter ATP-binding protein [Bacillus thuringiensis]MDR4286898.1 ABC transporter ATP-binding protein [Bacillus thuringiensis]MEB8597314.1 ABC transporter ATP-binding protein [Bacillus cereus]
MTDKAILNITDVTKFYGKQKVLENITLSIKEGEVVGLVGPNGAGKSTLMKIIVGLIRKYDGSVYVDGENILEEINKDRKRVGCIIESPGFYPNLSGYDNLLYFSKISGCSSEEEIYEIINLLAIKDFIHKKVKQYSLGMKQRLGLAQAILGNPKLLVLDEPTNGLDPNVIIDIRRIIKYLSEEKKTSIIISSHVLTEIESMCKEVIFIKNGKIIDRVSPRENKTESSSNYFVFEISDPKTLLNFFASKNISAVVDDTENVLVNLNDYTLQEILAMLIENNINIIGVHKQKENLEKRFLSMMEGNIVE